MHDARDAERISVSVDKKILHLSNSITVQPNTCENREDIAGKFSWGTLISAPSETVSIKTNHSSAH